MPLIRTHVALLLLLAIAIVSLATVSPANGATIIGANFDSNLSVIYDDSSGNLFLENAPLLNPAVQRLRIAASGGTSLIPANLSLPTLAPPVTITSNTTSLLDVEWSPGNFLGTGSFIGQLLASGIPVGTLLSDLTIDWAPASSSLTSGDLLYSTLGTTPGNPILPGFTSNGFFRFFDVASGQFFDPPFASGFLYEMTDGKLFTKLGLPEGFGTSFDVLVGGSPVATGLAGGSAFTFSGSGVSSFELVGIDPAVDASFGDAFPLYLEFNEATASFNMTAIEAIPEPSTLVLGLLGAVGLVWFARKRRRR